MALHPQVNEVRRNDIIQVKRYKSNVKFIAWKGRKFIGVMLDDGKTYKFAAELFDGIIEKAPKDMSWKQLKEGDPFIFSHKGSATLVNYVSFNSRKSVIEAVCPISGTRWNIGPDAYAGRLENFLQQEAEAGELVEA